MISLLIAHFTFHEVLTDAIVLAVFLFALRLPTFGNPVFRAIEKWGTRLAARKQLALAAIAAAPIVLRLGLLWRWPVPMPQIHDEFNYLLEADTFAHGRLTNPPHAMWIFFDTFHVNQHPTYMSKFPLAQGVALAVGQLFGHPWIGVVLSVAGMCAAVLWMLQGWLPPRWALLGGVLVVFRLGLFTYWMDSYWGGAVAAIGGALVVGALPRILRGPRTRDAVWMALGAAILMNSRPLEGLFFCVPVAGVLVVWLWSKRRPSWSLIFSRFLLPFGALALLSVGFLGYYNWRGTGNPFLLPYVWNEQTYVSTPTFLLMKTRPPLHYGNPQFEAFYNVWVPKGWRDGREYPWQRVKSILSEMTGFFFWPELCVPLLVLPCVLRRRRFFFLGLQVCFVLLAFTLTPWFYLHYVAPLTATLYALAVQGIRYVRRWKLQGRPVGVGLSRAMVVCTVLLSPIRPQMVVVGPGASPGLEYRAQFEKQLEGAPGEHLVIVRYAPNHDPGREWVYNRADIDGAKVVWAREIPGVDPRPLLDYFRGRRVWLVHADTEPPLIEPYTARP